MSAKPSYWDRLKDFDEWNFKDAGAFLGKMGGYGAATGMDPAAMQQVGRIGGPALLGDGMSAGGTTTTTPGALDALALGLENPAVQDMMKDIFGRMFKPKPPMNAPVASVGGQPVAPDPAMMGYRK